MQSLWTQADRPIHIYASHLEISCSGPLDPERETGMGLVMHEQYLLSIFVNREGLASSEMESWREV